MLDSTADSVTIEQALVAMRDILRAGVVDLAGAAASDREVSDHLGEMPIFREMCEALVYIDCFERAPVGSPQRDHWSAEAWKTIVAIADDAVVNDRLTAELEGESRGS